MSKYVLLSILIFFFNCKLVKSQNALDQLSEISYSNVYALLVGVSDYTQVKSLDFADKDAEIIDQVFKTSFPDDVDNIVRLTNNQATEIAIKRELKNMILKAKEGDLVIFYFSGHGDVVQDIVEGDIKGYFLAHNASADRVYDLGGAVEFKYVNNVINRITTDKGAEAWLITDACKSGKVINKSGATNTLTTLNQSFTNSSKFISCSANELSYEDTTLSQGVFTYYLVRALSGEADTDDFQGVLTIDEINSFMKSNVRAYTKNAQTPKITSSNEFKNIFNTNSDFLTLIKDVSEIGPSDLAMAGRGKGEGEEKLPEIIAIEEQIVLGNLYDSKNSAYALYTRAIDAGTAPEITSLMKDLLLDALLDRGQRNSNLFLSGRPTVSHKEDFKTTIKDFKLASDLLEVNDPMIESLQARITFFEAMDAVQSRTSLEAAEQKLLELSSKYPDAAHLNQGLALLYLTKSDKENAEKQLAQAQEKVSTWSKPNNTKLLIEIVSGNLKVAEEMIHSAMSNTETPNENIYLLKARMHMANFELQKASNAVSGLNETDIDQSSKLELQARIDELRGRVSKAQELYKHALSEDKSNVDLVIKLGEIYKNERDTSKALEYFQKAKLIDPNNSTIEFNIEALNGKTIDVNKIKLNTQDAESILALSSLLQEQNQFSEAALLLEELTNKIKWNPDIYYELGKAQYGALETEKSIKSLKDAIELSPYHFNSLVALVRIYINNKQYPEARGIIEKHNQYFKESAKWLTFTYKSYKRMGDKSNQFVLLEKAIKIDSLETDIYRELYKLHLENGDFFNAEREFSNLLRIGSKEKDSNEYLHYVKAEVLEHIANHYYETVDIGLDILLKEDPFNFDYIYYMALTKYMKMDYDGANSELRKFSKYLKSLSPGTQIEYYKLKGKVFLETKMYTEASRAFSMVNGSTGKKCYLGTAMAQFELGSSKWLESMRRDSELIDFNEDALKRLEKMNKKAAKIKPGPSGGAHRNQKKY